jgi:NAD(P)-dependent dehydrogenase (short-subunit alcohol dehydrogenase family)
LRDLAGKVAVVTGGASGIGLALARRAAKEGMKVALADIEEEALATAETGLRDAGATVFGVTTDVSNAGDVDALAERVLGRFGGVHLVCNNAGVGLTAPVWEYTADDWEWVLGVNLFGVINGVRTFVPLMLDGGQEGHVVNTASVAGLTSQPGLGAYNVSKHGVVTLSETLYHDLALAAARVGVSVLCPGGTETAILRAERNRPAGERTGAGHSAGNPEIRALNRLMFRGLSRSQTPDEVGGQVFEGVAEGRFWIRAEPPKERDWDELIGLRTKEIIGSVNPADPSASEIRRIGNKLHRA